MMHRQKQPAGKRKTVISSGATLVELTGVPADRLAAAERGVDLNTRHESPIGFWATR